MFFILLTCLVFAHSSGFQLTESPLGNVVDPKVGPGEPLFLTPLIEAGKIQLAQQLSEVKPFLKNIKSYSGFLTVDKLYNSNTFFWFFPSATTDWNKSPVAVWLQGGPGASSLFGLFLENGPYQIKNNTLSARFYSWHKKCNIIFIDNPVGTGFSFTSSSDGYTRNQTIIGEHLYSAVQQFFLLFPNLRNNEFYIAGESYAGKYVPALAYTIHKKNPTSDLKVNLKRLLIGNGLTDPVNMMKYGDYLYELGLIDGNGRSIFHEYETSIIKNVDDQNWIAATDLLGKLVLGYYYYPYKTLLTNLTGIGEHFNYINEKEETWSSEHSNFVNSNLFRRSLHIGDRTYSDGRIVASNLKEDMLKSVINLIVELLEHYPVVFYNGQLDIICAYPLTVNFLDKMSWKGADKYRSAPRNIWRVGKDVAGYYKVADNLYEVLVRNAGHMVPTSQPYLAYILFNSFINSTQGLF